MVDEFPQAQVLCKGGRQAASKTTRIRSGLFCGSIQIQTGCPQRSFGGFGVRRNPADVSQASPNKADVLFPTRPPWKLGAAPPAHPPGGRQAARQGENPLDALLGVQIGLGACLQLQMGQTGGNPPSQAPGGKAERRPDPWPPGTRRAAGGGYAFRVGPHFSRPSARRELLRHRARCAQRSLPVPCTLQRCPILGGSDGLQEGVSKPTKGPWTGRG